MCSPVTCNKTFASLHLLAQVLPPPGRSIKFYYCVYTYCTAKIVGLGWRAYTQNYFHNAPEILFTAVLIGSRFATYILLVRTRDIRLLQCWPHGLSRGAESRFVGAQVRGLRHVGGLPEYGLVVHVVHENVGLDLERDLVKLADVGEEEEHQAEAECPLERSGAHEQPETLV